MPFFFHAVNAIMLGLLSTEEDNLPNFGSICKIQFFFCFSSTYVSLCFSAYRLGLAIPFVIQ